MTGHGMVAVTLALMTVTGGNLQGREAGKGCAVHTSISRRYAGEKTQDPHSY